MGNGSRAASNTGRICFVGYMAGARPGFTTSQGYVLSRLLIDAGWNVTGVSTYHNRWARLADTLSVIARNGSRFSLIVMEVYGGRAFVLADVCSALAAWMRIPVVMVLHGGSLHQMANDHARWLRRVLSRAAVRVAPSRFLARVTEEALGLQVEVIPNVVPIEQYRFRVRRNVRPRLFWMRNFHEIYNPRMAVRVLGRLKKQYPDAQLVMGGRDDDRCAAVREFARAEGLGESVSFPGFLNLEAKLRAAEASDVFLNSNRVDNMPVAVVEACALGLPVVATSTGGIPDLLTHESTGLLVPDDDDEAMAEAVRRLIEDPALTERLSRNGRELAENSASARVVPRWEEVLRRGAPGKP